MSSATVASSHSTPGGRGEPRVFPNELAGPARDLDELDSPLALEDGREGQRHGL